MTKHFSPRRVAKPGAPGLRALLTTTSIAATLGGWALFATHDTVTDTLPSSQALEAPVTQQTFAVDIPALPTIQPLPTLVPPPPNMASMGVAVQAYEPTQVPTVVQPSTQPPPAPTLALRTVRPPAVGSRKAAPLTTTRSSR